MTRFARAEGSKASNKRECEDATPWEVMKNDMIIQKKKRKNKNKNEQTKSNLLNFEEKNINDSLTKLRDTKSNNNDKNNNNYNKDGQSEMKDNKRKSKGVSLEDMKKNWVIENGKRYKVFKDGIRKPWIDLAYEENDVMTRFNNFFIKREDVSELNQFKKSLEDQHLNEKMITKKIFYKEMKLHNKLRIELMRKEIKKNKKDEKPEINVASVKSIDNKSIKKSEEIKKNKKDEKAEINVAFVKSIDNKSIKKSEEIKKNKKDEKAEINVAFVKSIDNKSIQKSEEEIKKNKKDEKPEINVASAKSIDNKSIKKSEREIKKELALCYQENEIMTNFGGYWIRRENLQHLQSVAVMKIQRIISNRTNGNTDKNLTPDEELIYRRLMKKEKRRENNLLLNFLMNKNKNKIAFHTENQNGTGGQKQCQNNWNDSVIKYDGFYDQREGAERLATLKGGQKQCQNNWDDSVVKYDGFYVQREGAERLAKLKETMLAKGCTEEEITEVMKTERRKEERLLKRSNSSFCYQCREPGHVVSCCPQNEREGKSNNYVICYKCGSAEHTVKNCRSQNKSSSAYPLAKCFICNEIGHISRECPDNPKGLYPNGGCCKICGSVEHLRKDCPELQEQKAEETMTLSVFRRGDNVEEIENDFQSSSPSYSQANKKPRRIIFDD